MHAARSCMCLSSESVRPDLHACPFFFTTVHRVLCIISILCVPLFLCLCARVCTCAGARGRAVPQWMRPVRVEGRVLVHLHYQHSGRPASLRGGGPKPQDQVSERVSAGRLRAWHRNTIWEEKTGNRHWHALWSWHWHRERKTNSEHTLLLTAECYLIFYFISCGAQKDIETSGSMLTLYAHRQNGCD